MSIVPDDNPEKSEIASSLADALEKINLSFEIADQHRKNNPVEITGRIFNEK